MLDSLSTFSKYLSRSPQETKWCSEYCKKWWPKSVDHIIRIANEVSKNRFIFDLPWDMERTTEIISFDNEIIWDYMPKDDPEFIFQMNRHRYWICLGQAYSITKDEEYALAFARQLESWIKNNPITNETKLTSWRTIEAGIRGENWVKAMGYFIDSPMMDKELLDMYFNSLVIHGEYILECEVPFSDKSNWGILENRGLYFIGKALGEHPRAKVFSEIALKRLEKQIRIQIMDDGVHWEQSPMYHNEVLRCYLEVIRLAEKFGEKLPQIVYNKVKSMANANLKWKKPNNCQIAAGDSDETDIRDILSVSAYQFNDEYLKYVGYDKLDFEAIWDYGKEATIEYEKLEDKEPRDKCYSLKESGNWYIRSGWKEDDDFLHFRCGALGGGHGHYDKLHIDLAILGEDILVDSGRYTYVDCKIRRDLKSTFYHNSPRVDSREYTQCLDSWAGTPITSAINQNSVTKDKYTYLEGGHLGYIEDKVYVNRRVIAIGTKIYVVIDEFYGEGRHKYEQLYHFNPIGKIKAEDNKFTFIGNKAKVDFYNISTDTKITKIESIYSKHYNILENNEKVIVSKEEDTFSSIITVIVGQEVDANKIYTVDRVEVVAPVTNYKLSDNEAEGIHIKGEDEEYLILVNHLETGCNFEYIGAMGINGLGSVMVCDIKNDNKEMTILKW